MNLKHQTPLPAKPQDLETSAYRSYQRRENQRISHQPVLNTEAFERFTSIVEMLHTNKVTKANAFENRMIDYLSDIFRNLDKNAQDPETIWQKYSTGVDSCGKIYSYCVDFIHSETFRILGGLNRTGNLELDPNNEHPEEENENENKPKKKRRAIDGSSTLELNPQAITTTKFDKYEKFDPYFKSVSSRFDASTASGLLLNNFSLTGTLDLPLGNEKPLTNATISEDNPRIGMDGLLNFTLESLTEEHLCKGIDKFIEAPRAQVDGIGNILESMNIANDMFENSDSEESVVDEESEEEVWNAYGGSAVKDQEDIEDEFEIVSESLQQRINKLSENDDYHYFSDPKLSAWGGFEYWKKVPVPSNKAEKPPRKKKEVTSLVLEPTPPAHLLALFEPAKKGYPVYYSDAVIKKWGEACRKVPEDYGITLFRLTQLYTRPRTQIKTIKTSNQEVKTVVIEEGIQSCSDDENALFAEELSQYQVPAEEKLDYATTSKTINIKLLKETIWKKFEKENDKENREVSAGKKNTFLGIIDYLPKNLPAQEVQNLSIHSCFITMLHLANEHDLRIEQTAPCDFIIHQAEN